MVSSVGTGERYLSFLCVSPLSKYAQLSIGDNDSILYFVNRIHDTGTTRNTLYSLIHFYYSATYSDSTRSEPIPLSDLQQQ